jgi:hypothetical protein
LSLVKGRSSGTGLARNSEWGQLEEEQMLRAIVTAILACVASGCGCSDTGLEGGPDGDTSEIGTPVEDGFPVDGTPTDGPGTTDASWDPPVDGMGEPGWRDSVDPVCREDLGVSSAVGLWSDERGVFVILGTMSGMTQASLIWNGGTGWSTIATLGDMYEISDLANSLTGFPGGDVIAFSPYSGMRIFSPPDWSSSIMDFYPAHVFVVDHDLAYATLDGDPRLARYDGSSWGPFPGEPLPYTGRLVWADGTSVFVAGDAGMILSYEDEHWTVHDTRTMEPFISLWGFSADDVWAGTTRGHLLHWDGLEWRTVEWPNLGDDSDECHASTSGIEGMWGVDGVLFFHSSEQLVMWDGVEFVTLGYWPGEKVEEDGIFYCVGGLHVHSIWGNSPTELFIAIEESERVPHVCDEYIMWWDGSLFHWF